MSKTSPSGEPLLNQEQRQLEEIVEQFEAAWLKGPSPRIDDFLPRNQQRRAVLVELAQVDLECRIKAGEPVRAEEYLERYPELGEDENAFFDLVCAEYELRRRREPGFSKEAYYSRFPEYVDRGQVKESAGFKT